MSRYWYRDGATYVVVETGMPERAVEIGTGETPREAVESLQMTAMQSVGRDGGVRGALDWARNAGWILEGNESDASAWDLLDGADEEECEAEVQA